MTKDSSLFIKLRWKEYYGATSHGRTPPKILKRLKGLKILMSGP